jgi:hypothetical protein
MITFEDGRFYIGSRKSKVPAVEDIHYFGSPGKVIEHLWEMKKEKHILFESTDISYKDLIDKEKIFIREGWKNFGKDKCINKNVGGYIDPELLSKLSKKSYADGRNALANLTHEERVANQLKAAITKSVEFQVRDPNGKIHTGKGIYPFAKKHGLSGANLWEVVRGRYDSYKGWTNIDVDPSTILTTLEKHQKLREAGKGIWSKESREKSKQTLIEQRAVEYHVVSPDGKEYKGKNATEFMREHGLSGPFIQLLSGQVDHHKGWTRYGHPLTYELEMDARGSLKPKSPPFKLRGPDGKIYEGNCRRAFARKHGLTFNNVSSVLNGHVGNSNGWTLPIPKHDKRWDNLKIKVKSPEGKIYEVENRKKFCEEHKLVYSGFLGLTGNSRKSYRGWTRA